MLFLKLSWESFRFAISALKSNLTRTILSLLGVTIGIFAIIAVFTLVDSLEQKIKSSFAFLGTNVMRVDRFPFANGPQDYPWWKYFQRPPGTYAEYKFLEERLTTADGVTISASSSATVQAGSNSYEGTSLSGVAYTYQDVFEVALEEGRYFSEAEINASRNLIIVGKKIANTLFPSQEALGKEVKIKGMKFTIIGIFEEEGEGFLELPSKDEACLVPFGAFSKMYYTGRDGLEPTIAELIYEVQSVDNLERSVRMVILLLVFVFDPLAIVLLIAANIGITNQKRFTKEQNIGILEIDDKVLDK